MKPLSRKRRMSSVIGMLILFIVAVPILVSYSSGYRFSFEDFGFTKTGGVFIQSDLSGTRVFVDDEFVEDNGLILRNTLIQNLKSEELYSIRVEKEGYFTWYKDLYIYPNLVTEAAVMMLPTEIIFEKILPTFVSGKDKGDDATSTVGLDVEVNNNLPNPEFKTAFDLFGPATSSEKLFVVETPFNELVPTTSISLGGESTLLPSYILDLGIENIEEKEMVKELNKIVTWIEGGDVHVAWTGKHDSTPFYFCDIRGCRDQIFVSLETDIEYYDFFPERNDVLIVKTHNHIFAVEIDDRSKQNVQVIYKSDNSEDLGFRLVRDTIYIKDGEDIYKAQI